jgi:hypothetical protein
MSTMTPKIGIYKNEKIDFFALENANISQLFLLDKLVSGLGLQCSTYF